MIDASSAYQMATGRDDRQSPARCLFGLIDPCIGDMHGGDVHHAPASSDLRLLRDDVRNDQI